MLKLQKKNFFYYSLILLPFTYLVGIMITEVFVVLITLFFLINNRDFAYFKDKKFILLFLISIYICLNALIQIDDNLKISSLFHFRYIIFSLSIFFCLKYFEETQHHLINSVLYVIFFILSLVLFDAFFQFIIGENILGYEIFKNRISGFFENELILGSFLIKILPIFTWLLFYSNFNIKQNKNWLIIFFSSYLICIFLTAERTSLGLTIIYFILIILLISPLRKIFLFSLPIIFSLIITISYFEIGKTDPTSRIFVKTFNQFTNEYFLNKKTEKLLNKNPLIKKEEVTENLFIFSRDHTGHFQLAFELFKKNPIFGVGPKGFRHYCREVNYDPEIGICSTHPHNFLVQITSETGIIGFILYSFAILFIIYKLIKCQKVNTSSKNKLSLIIISIGIIVNLFPFLPSGNFFNNWISIINYYFLGIYFYSYSKVYK